MLKWNPIKLQVAIIGGGIIGLSIGWQLQRRGCKVTIFEENPTTLEGTSYVGAGMLAPSAEVNFEDERLASLGFESLAMYPEFLSQLEKDVGHAPELEEKGTYLIALDEDEKASLDRIFKSKEKTGIPAEWLEGTSLNEREPHLGFNCLAGIHLPLDAQVNNHRLIKDLSTAFRKKGGEFCFSSKVISVEQKEWGGGMVLSTSDKEYEFEEVVMAGGSRSTFLDDENEDRFVRPVKGQILTLENPFPFRLRSMIRTYSVYFVPKGPWYLLLGATSEEKGWEENPTAGGVMDLLKEGAEAIPLIRKMKIKQVNVGHRPATSNHLPVIGRNHRTGLYHATGHYRHGILLAPLTAMNVIKELLSGIRPKVFSGLGPRNTNQLV